MCYPDEGGGGCSTGKCPPPVRYQGVCADPGCECKPQGFDVPLNDGVQKSVSRYVFQVYLVGESYEVLKGTYSTMDGAVARFAAVSACEELLPEEYLTIERYAVDEAVNTVE